MFNLPPDPTVDKLLDQVHPAVEAHGDRWQICLDAYDGDGGFLDGGYLWRFPREVETEWTARKAQARYHNYAATIVDFYVRKVFGSDPVSRGTSSTELEEWFNDVDGSGTDLTSYMRTSLAKALASGHLGLLADKTVQEATGPAKADEQSQVFLTRFLPTHIKDWRTAHDETIVSVKLQEDTEPTDLLEDRSDTDKRVLLWDQDEWVRIEQVGDEAEDVKITRGNTGIGLVPLVVFKPFASGRWPLVGRSLLGDGSVLKAIYNRGSEEDDVMRDQAFSLFVVSLPVTGEVDVEKAKVALGPEVGSTRAVFCYGSGAYQTPDMAVPATLRDSQSFLIRELYRQAHIPHDKDSKDAVSAEAMELTHEELYSVLRAVADECKRVEEALCKLFFAWTSASPEQAIAAFEAAELSITYPEITGPVDLEQDVKGLTAAMTAVPSKTFEKVVQKSIVASVPVDISDEDVETILGEIDAGEAERQPPMLPDLASMAQGIKKPGPVVAEDEGEAA